MDLLRSTLEAAFYHFPIASLAKMLIGDDDDILSIISEIIKWERPEYSSTEISILSNILENEWMVNNTWHFNSLQYSKLSRIFLILNQFASHVLITSQNQIPRVKFDQLLRWRDTSLLVGEDLLITSYLAEDDLKRCIKHNEFVWPDVLEHDNFKLNDIINQELSDTHSHINAAFAVFDFNWICLMNYPHLVNVERTKRKGFLKDGAMQSYDPISHHSLFNNWTLSQWIQIAAAIRVRLYDEVLNDGIYQDNTFFQKLLEAFQNPFVFAQLFEDTKCQINLFRSNALKTDRGYAFDYAIRQLDTRLISPSALVSPYMVHHGERKLLYTFFYNYLGNSKKMRNLAPWIYFYVLVKNKVRREFIQTNQLVGFDNFDEYQKSKSQFKPRLDKQTIRLFEEIAYKYAVQTSLGPNLNHHLEARVTPSDIKRLLGMDYTKSIFGNVEVIPKEKQNCLTLVAHFIKTKDKVQNSGMLRQGHSLNQLWKQIHMLEQQWNYDLAHSDCHFPQLVGIDAASSEFNCRPEVFAPIFRYARFRGMSNQTFHAGEDFYDLLDGLRTVDETIFYMRFTLGNRIGHGLALGTPAVKYYKSRHNTIIIPQQILLDNLVWLKYRTKEFNISLSEKVQLFIEQNYMRLLSLLRYPICDMYTYWQSMLHRGDLHSFESGLSDDIKYTLPEEQRNLSGNVKLCLDHYLYSKECKEEGNKAITLKLPDSFPVDIQQLQSSMLKQIGKIGIVIECNPSSNLKIGRFSRYDEHPIFNFHPIDGISHSTLCVSINTDDRGVFATSLCNEYSLIAASLYKQTDNNGNCLWTDVQIEEYIKRIAHYGNLSRFTLKGFK